MSNKNQQIPAIRFKGFTDDWEQRKLGELCHIGDIDHRMPASVSVGIPYVMTGDFIGNNDIDFENAKRISEEDYEQLAKKIKPEKGDILFARYASVGTVRYVETNQKFLISYSCAILKPNEDIEGKYLYFYIQTGATQQRIELEINTGSQRNIGIDSLKNNIAVSVPKIGEQSKIGTFFKQLDDTIALHQRQLNNYKELKQTMLKKIFNQELRFKDQNGNDYPNWEEKKLGEIAKYTNGKSNEGNVLENGKYNLINLNSISIDGKLKNVHKSTDIVTVLLKKDDLVMILSDVGHGDLLGRVAVIPENEKYVLNQRVAGLSVVKLANPTYLYYFINFHQKYFKLMGKGMAQLNISKGDVEDFVVQLPYEDEQHKIADFLSTIDKQLETVEQTVKLLEEQKKGLMQKMFV